MAKQLVFDKKHYGNDGLIPLRRGDDWVLEGEVVQKSGNYTTAVDLTGASATGWFEGDDGDVTVTPEITNAEAGKVKLTVPASSTSAVKVASEGTSCYLTLSMTEGLTTVEMTQSDLEIKEREYSQF